jgi:hypothetical protein
MSSIGPTGQHFLESARQIQSSTSTQSAESTNESTNESKGFLANVTSIAVDSNIVPLDTTKHHDNRRVTDSNTFMANIGDLNGSSDADAVLKLKQQDTNMKSEGSNRRLGSMFKTGISTLFASLSVASGGPWAVLSQPLYRAAVNAVSKAGQGFSKADQGQGLRAAGSAFIASLAADARGAMTMLRKVAQQPGKYLLSQSHAPKTWGNVGAVVGGLVGASLGGPLGAMAGFALGKAVGTGLGYAASKAASMFQARGDESRKDFGLSAQGAIRQTVSAGLLSLTNEEADNLKGQIKDRVAIVNKAQTAVNTAKDNHEVSPSDDTAKELVDALAKLKAGQEDIITLTQLLRDNGRADDDIDGMPVRQAVRVAKADAEGTQSAIAKLKEEPAKGSEEEAPADPQAAANDGDNQAAADGQGAGLP